MTVSQNEALEIQAAQEAAFTTKRATVNAVEEILYEPLPVLDHGFVRVIDYMGEDSAIVQAARVSYGKGTKRLRDDEALIRYLMRHRHTTPFEMCEIKFHIKLPVFVARQWIRHRTANVNEYSARYSILDREFYIPEPSHLAAQSDTNRQGRGDTLQGEEAERVLSLFKDLSAQSYEAYQEMLNENDQGENLQENRQGLTRELARMILPINVYTQWYWKVNLHNLLHFLALRADPHAQYEIRAYADVMLKIVEKWVPLAFKAFQDYRMNGVSFSEKGLSVIQKLIRQEKVTQEESGLGVREWYELITTLGINL